jgi:hypothetical protein
VNELRYNPFLKHWVEVVVRIQPLVLKVLRGEEIPGIVKIPDWWAKAQAARLLLIKWALGLTVRLLAYTSCLLENSLS